MGFQLSPEQKIKPISLKLKKIDLSTLPHEIQFLSQNQAFFKIHHKMTNSVIFLALHVGNKSNSKTFLFGARGRKKYSQEGES